MDKIKTFPNMKSWDGSPTGGNRISRDTESSKFSVKTALYDYLFTVPSATNKLTYYRGVFDNYIKYVNGTADKKYTRHYPLWVSIDNVNFQVFYIKMLENNYAILYTTDYRGGLSVNSNSLYDNKITDLTQATYGVIININDISFIQTVGKSSEYEDIIKANTVFYKMHDKRITDYENFLTDIRGMIFRNEFRSIIIKMNSTFVSSFDPDKLEKNFFNYNNTAFNIYSSIWAEYHKALTIISKVPDAITIVSSEDIENNEITYDKKERMFSKNEYDLITNMISG